VQTFTEVSAPVADPLLRPLPSIWDKFIPADDYHVFQRGAYFSAEVIPDQLAVISLNTLYWYDANKGVPGLCASISTAGPFHTD
jgi:endopolyphosphatase